VEKEKGIIMLFKELNGRLREIKTITRPTADGRGTITFKTFMVEIPFSSDTQIDVGKLLLVETIRKGVYLILEITDYIPQHFGMINLDGTIPPELRNEIMRRIEETWNTNQAWIDVIATPVGYIMKEEDGKIEFKKGYVPPLPASKVKLFTSEALEKFIFYPEGTILGKSVNEEIDLKVNLLKAINYHIGVFAYTGSGKSNLTSLIVRRALNKYKDLKVVIIDVSMEYSILLLDELLSLNSRLVTLDRLPSNELDAGKRLLRTHVLPEELEDVRESIRKGFIKLYTEQKLRRLYIPPQGISYLSYGTLIEMIRSQIEDKYVSTSQKPLFMALLQSLDNLMRERKLTKDDIVDDTINPLLREAEEKAREAGVRDGSVIFTFLSSIKTYIQVKPSEVEEYDVESLAIEILDQDPSSPRLFVVETPNIDDARLVTHLLIENIYMRRKRAYSSLPVILFVLDEAQEFIPFETRQKDYTEQSSSSVEKLLRHGRKYHLHALISTQRLAYLNTNVLQQIHTYFVSTLPRPYDRQLISDTFGISDSLVDRTLNFDIGQWLLISFKAALKEDIPVMFKAENNVQELKENLKRYT